VKRKYTGEYDTSDTVGQGPVDASAPEAVLVATMGSERDAFRAALRVAEVSNEMLREMVLDAKLDALVLSVCGIDDRVDGDTDSEGVTLTVRVIVCVRVDEADAVTVNLRDGVVVSV